MKKFTLIVLSISVYVSGYSQIPNAGLETWMTETQTATNFVVPQHWTTSDELVYAFDNGYAGASVSKTASSHSGSFAAFCQVAVNHGDTVNGVLYSCDSLSQLLSFTFTGKICGFPCTIRPASLQGYYKFNGVGGDSAAFLVYLTKWNIVSHKRDTIVYTFYETNVNAASYTLINVPLHYINNAEYPDTAIIGTGIEGKFRKTAHIGSTFYIDDLAFNGTVNLGVNNLSSVGISSVFYPNPFDNNATLNVNGPVKICNARLEIYDVLGQCVRDVQNINQTNIPIVKGDLQNGVYFYRLINKGEIITTGKFILN